VRRLAAAVRDLSLNAKVTLTLILAFGAIVAAFLLFLVPFLREQRASLLEKDQRLLATLRSNYERDFIYDLLSENQDSLAIHLAGLASQKGVLWVRVEAPGVDLAATADRPTILRLLGNDAEAFDREDAPVLLLRANQRADLVGAGGRPLLSDRQLPPEGVPAWKTGVAAKPFAEVRSDNQPALYYRSDLAAAGEPFGRLHVLYSLAQMQRSQTLTHTLFYGLTGTAFVLLLLLLNLLISRIVIRPVRRVQQAMSRAATGELEVRLPVHSRDELGRMADAFNRMAEELAGSKREVEDYSRNLETMVEARTRELAASQAELLALKNHLATIIANVGTGVISLDETGRIETFNRRAAEILSVDRAGAAGRTLAEVLPEGDLRRLLDLVATVNETDGLRREAQLVCQLPQGRRTLSVVASALLGEGRRRTGTVVVCEDLTQILASQRLTAWKEAVERVIHEIKNPLTPVGLAAQTLKSAHERNPEMLGQILPPAVDMILSSVRDLRELISEFARFSRLPEIRPERCLPNELVQEALAPYAHGGIQGIGLRLELADSLPAIEADRDQLKRVLLNVVNNAFEAMEGGGGELLVATRRQGDTVVVTIRDQGPGVEDVERIFEPHYTTKVKGTGLGLAIARQIVEEHGGSITVESQLGVGTTVSIGIPAAPA
jgi:PAS domain S-box-containing protein